LTASGWLTGTGDIYIQILYLQKKYKGQSQNEEKRLISSHIASRVCRMAGTKPGLMYANRLCG